MVNLLTSHSTEHGSYIETREYYLKKDKIHVNTNHIHICNAI